MYIEDINPLELAKELHEVLDSYINNETDCNSAISDVFTVLLDFGIEFLDMTEQEDKS